jgi:hypothetical protein
MRIKSRDRCRLPGLVGLELYRYCHLLRPLRRVQLDAGNVQCVDRASGTTGILCSASPGQPCDHCLCSFYLLSIGTCADRQEGACYAPSCERLRFFVVTTTDVQAANGLTSKLADYRRINIRSLRDPTHMRPLIIRQQVADILKKIVSRPKWRVIVCQL